MFKKCGGIFLLILQQKLWDTSITRWFHLKLSTFAFFPIVKYVPEKDYKNENYFHRKLYEAIPSGKKGSAILSLKVSSMHRKV